MNSSSYLLAPITGLVQLGVSGIGTALAAIGGLFVGGGGSEVLSRIGSFVARVPSKKEWENYQRVRSSLLVNPEQNGLGVK